MESYHGKRAFDLVVVALTAPLWMPVSAIIAVLTWANLGRPVLFTQDRVGLGERTFRIRKFRTMRDAFDAHGAPLPDADRLVPFGRWLRATSLDELPELFNVIAGEMSLVGPRPLLTRYLERYSPRHRRRHAVRPGLTGLAQVGGRNALTWDDKFELDMEYVERNSMLLDIRILLRTVRAVFSREGIVAPGDVTAPEFLGYKTSKDKS